MDDLISRQEVLDAIEDEWHGCTGEYPASTIINDTCQRIEQLPSAEPEPLSQAYARAVWTWLLNYQIKSAELKGAYSPYEILSWVTNDWRKENGLDKQTTGD